MNLKQATSKFITCAEEYEREIRLLPQKMEDMLQLKERALNAAYSTLLEEQERVRRVELYLAVLISAHTYWHAKQEIPTDDIQHDITIPEVTRLEEEERQRRIKEDGTSHMSDGNLQDELTKVQEEQSKDDKAFVIIKEEEERQRRIAEDSTILLKMTGERLYGGSGRRT